MRTGRERRGRGGEGWWRWSELFDTRVALLLLALHRLQLVERLHLRLLRLIATEGRKWAGCACGGVCVVCVRCWQAWISREKRAGLARGAWVVCVVRGAVSRLQLHLDMRG